MLRLHLRSRLMSPCWAQARSGVARLRSAYWAWRTRFAYVEFFAISSGAPVPPAASSWSHAAEGSPTFAVVATMARVDPFEAVERDSDIACQGAGQRTHRVKCKSVAFRRFTDARRAGKPFGREEQVDNGSVGTSMHGANEPPIVRFHDQAGFLKQFA